MNEEDPHLRQSLLREIAAHQESIERRLAAIESAQLETWKKYEATDAAYRGELSTYKQERLDQALGRKVATAARGVILLLLLYVAYRIS